MNIDNIKIEMKIKRSNIWQYFYYFGTIFNNIIYQWAAEYSSEILVYFIVVIFKINNIVKIIPL